MQNRYSLLLFSFHFWALRSPRRRRKWMPPRLVLHVSSKLMLRRLLRVVRRAVLLHRAKGNRLVTMPMLRVAGKRALDHNQTSG
jgi:hypothetical protein